MSFVDRARPATPCIGRSPTCCGAIRTSSSRYGAAGPRARVRGRGVGGVDADGRTPHRARRRRRLEHQSQPEGCALLEGVDAPCSCFPHMGDGGLALGAALLAAAQIGCHAARRARRSGIRPAVHRPADRIRRCRRAGSQYRHCPDIASTVGVSACGREDRAVVPGADGIRSAGAWAIAASLARPDRPALRDRLNLVLKRRVWYQPFCPEPARSRRAGRAVRLHRRIEPAHDDGVSGGARIPRVR